MRRSRIAVAAATATALVGSIAAITPSPQAEASSNRPRSVAQAAIATDGKGIINKDCRDAVINDSRRARASSKHQRTPKSDETRQSNH